MSVRRGLVGWGSTIALCFLASAASGGAGAFPDACGGACGRAGLGAAGTELVQAARIDAQTVAKYGAVLGLGDRAPQFAADIAVIRDAVARGDRAAVAAGIQALYKKAGHLIPVGTAMEQLVDRLPPSEAGSGTGTAHGPDQPLGGSIAEGGAAPNPPAQSAALPQSSSGGPGPNAPLGGSDGQGSSDTGAGSSSTTGAAASAPPGASTPTPAGSGQRGPNLPLGASSSQPAAPKAGSGLNMPLGEPPAEHNPPAAGTTAAGASEAKCGGAQNPVALDQLIGIWTDSATGATVEIKRESIYDRPNDGVELHGQKTWHGRFQNQTLKFTRRPLAEEMGEAPDWAREQAYGKIEWELELQAKTACGGLVLEGKWYPGSFKWREEIDPNSGAPPARTVSDFGRGTPIDKKYTKPPPVISDTIVLTDQTAMVIGETLKWPYSQAAGDTRVLFVYGRGLPLTWSDRIEFESGDPNISYFAVALDRERNLAEMRKTQFETGWRTARLNLDEDTITLTRDLTAVLVYARTKTGVLPGMKQFKLNGLEASWRLRFGDDRATITFMRAITSDIADPTENIVLPERLFLQVRTGADFPIDAIPLKVQVNDKPVTWNGAPTIPARRVAPGVYRTDTIEFIEEGKPMPAPEKGVYFLPVRLKDKVAYRPEDPFLLGVSSANAAVPVLRTPAELGTTWKEALVRAAKADGFQEVTDWNRLSATKATEITNYILTPIILEKLESSTPLMFLRYVPRVYQYVQEAKRGDWHISTPVKVGDHAALLLFRDEFVRSMKVAVKNLDMIKGTAALRGFREAVKASAWDENSPWRYLRVSCPDGGGSLGSPVSAAGSVAAAGQASAGDCSFPYVVSDTYLEQIFGSDRKKADAWVQRAVDEAIRNYRQAAQDAIVKAEAIEDKDVKGLLKLVGYSYLPMLPAVQARLLRLDEVGNPPRQLWVPDLNGRYLVRNLHTVAEAVQAQEDYSKLDTQMAMLLMAAVTAPFMLEEGVVAAVIAWGTDTAFSATTLATDVPDYIEQREEIRFALGASIILGTQRLQEAELRKTEWFQLLTSVVPAALGPVLSTARMVGVIRTSLIIAKVEAEGVKALEAMSAADRAAFWRFATEAKWLEEMGETKAMTAMHRRAIAAADEVTETLKLKPGDIPEVKVKASIAAKGEPGPAELPKTKTLRAEASPDSTITVIEAEQSAEEANAGKPASGAAPEPEKPAAGTPAPAPPPGEKTPSAAAAGEVPPGKSPKPEANKPWPTMYNGKAKVLQLGERLGGGGYAQVFELIDKDIPGCENGCVIKIVSPDPRDTFFGTNTRYTGERVNVVRNIEYCSDLVDQAGDIPQLRNLHFFPDAPTPYFIQELKQPNQYIFQNMANFKLAAAKLPGMRKAVVELAYKLRSHGLVWEDFKVNNMVFFTDVEGKWGARGEWVAAIIDHDRIVPFAQRNAPGNLGAWIGFMEADFLPEHLASMKRVGKRIAIDNQVELVRHFRDNPGPYFRDIDLFWEKQFERKMWLEFDEATGAYKEGGLQPSDVDKRFPLLNDPARLDPFDPGIEFNLPRRSGSLNVIPFRAERQFARAGAPSDLKQAA